MSQPNLLRTRYPGLASFTTAEKDLFFGRKQETRDLANLLSVERTVVLFSASGIGKTSLLQAGVMPLLYGQLMVPVPIRFGTADLLPEQHFSVQLDAAAQRFAGQEGQRATDTSARETFWGQIARQPFGQMPAQFTPLFIFDQFEELFTLYPEREKRARFVAELADIIQERLPAALRERILTDLERGKISPEQAAALEKPPPMRFIFSIRSDMLHFMDELSEAIPYILRSRFQLFGLDEKNAREALVEPASLAGAGFASRRFGYTAGAQAEILEVLGKKGEVESFQLQAVCQAIEEKIIRSARQKHDTTELFEKDATLLPLVPPDFYGGRAGIDAILDENYNRRIDSLAETDEAWPAHARHILEDVLVNKNDRRQSVDVTSIDAPAALLDELERQRLVRKEARLESFYYEISHDTWLKPVLRSRDERRKEEERARIARERAEADRRRRRALVTSFVAGVLAFGAGLAIVYAIQKITLAEKLLKASKSIAAQKLPDSFDTLTQLDSLDCSNWNLDEFSTEIGKLQNLQKLNLSNNNLSKLPAQISELKNLTSLNLANNRLTRLPSQILELKNLTSLILTSNSLTKLHLQIGELKNLTSLNLASNQFTMLPTQIGELKNLTILNLGGNQLTSLLGQIGELKNLTSLNLGGNQLTSLPGQIGELKNLTDLNLEGNQLTSLPGQIGGLKNLTDLNLSYNEISVLPVQIAELESLTSLYLEGNGLTALPEQIGELRNLTRMELSGNQLTVLPKKFADLKNLTDLNLGLNGLTTLPPQIAALENLIGLSLAINELTSLPAQILELKNLTELNLNSNQLTVLPAQIGNLKNLRSLDLSSNNLHVLPAQIGELKNLTELDLSFNQLTSLPTQLVELKNLTDLNLSNNRLTKLPAGIEELVNLQSLQLNGNSFSETERASIRVRLEPKCAIEF